MSKKKKNKRPQSFAPATAQADVTPSTTQTLTYDGHTYQVDFGAINDIDVLEAFQRGNRMLTPEMNGAIVALQKALGVDGYERFKADQIKKHGRCSATSLFEMFDMVDFGAGGNSPASSNSSSDEAKH